jgi:UDP-glucose 4-epimerase
MKILITGGAGFIGSHIVEAFQGRAEIVVFDNLRTGKRSNLGRLDHAFVDGDIEDVPALRKALAGVDHVFHLAALVSVPESMTKREDCVRINALGTLNVLRAAADAGVKKLVFASSAAVYGNNPASPKSEEMRPEPLSPYAVTKLDGEFYCDMFAREKWLPTAALRFFNVFGPRQDPASAYAAAVPIFIRQALAGRPLTVFGDGSQTRDFVFVRDIVRALEFCALTAGVTGVFNCGYGDSISIGDLIAIILRETSSSSAVTHRPPRDGDVRHSRSDPSRLLAAGWRPEHGLASGLAETIAAFREEAGRSQ